MLPMLNTYYSMLMNDNRNCKRYRNDIIYITMIKTNHNEITKNSKRSGGGLATIYKIYLRMTISYFPLVAEPSVDCI